MRIMVRGEGNYSFQLDTVIKFEELGESLDEANRLGLLLGEERAALERVRSELQKLESAEQSILTNKRFWTTREWQPTLAAAQKALNVIEANDRHHSG